jgi:hypothetical protein
LEGKIGAKIGILAVALAVPALIVEVVAFVLVLPFVRSWPNNAYILFAFVMLVLYGSMALLIVKYTTKPEYEEKLYQKTGSGILIGFMVCGPIALDFIFWGGYALGDAFTTSLIFFCGTLLIMSDIVMVYESKKGAEQVSHEE